MKITYVLPNLSTLQQRGGIESRTFIADSINQEYNTNDFEYIEMPGDFIKNASEVQKTGLSLGSMLNPLAVSSLYNRTDKERKPYVLHTEPALPRRANDNSHTPKLRWFDSSWVQEFVNHVVVISEFLGSPPAVVEVHPGTKQRGKNNVTSLVVGIRDFLFSLEEILGVMPKLLVENRTPHIVSTGQEIRKFFEEVESIDFTRSLPIKVILDIQQLFSKTKDGFQKELTEIPKEILGGFHIHQLHRSPILNGIIDWKYVSNFLRTGFSSSSLLILPEVHHLQQLKTTYQFCKNFLRL